MKSLVLPILAFFLCSCTKYQYATLNSLLPKTDDGLIYYEDDSVRITWSFKGKGCPVAVSFFNKTNVPLEIDWDRSVLVMDGQTVSYSSGTSKLTAESRGSELQWMPAFASNESIIEGVVTHEENSSFIPPGAHVRASPVSVREYFKVNAPMTREAGGSGVKKSRYTVESSPMHLTSYITYSSPGPGRDKLIKSDFWVSELGESLNLPAPYKMDTFHNSEITAVGGLFAVLFVVGWLILEIHKPAE